MHGNGWSFDFTKTPATNTIYSDNRHPSEIVLGDLAGGQSEAPLPACNTVLNQPCRQNVVAVPSGAMAIP